jgi:DNA-binding transcriptional LysR family regulator
MSYFVEDLRLFALVADTGNLSQAARELDLLPATASAAIKRLEARLDARLFERSTRHMRLTPQGEMFLEYCRDALALLEQGEALLGANAGRIQGKLRVAAPADWGRNVLAPMIDGFLRRHGGVKLVLHCADRSTDLFRDPVDLAFRYGPLEDASYVAQRLAANRRVVVAAPEYLRRRGTPAAPEDLKRHNCLVHSTSQGTSNTWRFSRGRKLVEVTVTGDRVADDGGLVREWAVAGAGIAYKSQLDAAADLAAGRLVALFPDYTGADWPLQVVYPHRSSLGPAARALLAHVMEAMKQ